MSVCYDQRRVPENVQPRKEVDNKKVLQLLNGVNCILLVL